jgi:membrane protease YdiL (CAAX protease family)
VVFRGGFGETEQELIWTGIRVISLVVLWMLFRGLLPRKKDRGPIEWYYFLAGAVLCLGPVLVGNLDYHCPLNWIFAVTSLAVGFREEFAYRAVLQTLLVRRIGFGWGLAVSSIAFALYHIGVQPFNPTNALFLAVFGMAAGILYHLSGSLVFVAMLHSIYDAIFCFSPYLKDPFPEPWDCLLALLVSFFLIFEVMTKPRPAE